MIIGVAGTHGAGKGAVVEYLVEQREFKHFSARELIKEEVARRGLPPTRPNISGTAAEMRRSVSPLWVVETLLSRAKEKGGNGVIESIYTLEEVAYLHKHDAILIAVDADIAFRYERIQKRGGETDQVSFEEFKARQEKEKASDDPQSQNAGAVIEKADFHIENNGTIKELQAQVEQILSKIKY